MRALRVLIIEDEPLIALLFEEVLSELGHEVCASVTTEAEAIEAAARCKPELIISDVRLKKGSGIDAVNAILRAGFVPHIFVSGDRLDRKLLNPAAGFLQKPFEERHLVDAIAHATDPANVLIGQKNAADAGRA
jgi:two-component system, response regulator PdtaR